MKALGGMAVVLGLTVLAACGGQKAQGLESARAKIDAFARQCRDCRDGACVAAVGKAGTAFFQNELSQAFPDSDKGWPAELEPALDAYRGCLAERAGDLDAP